MTSTIGEFSSLPLASFCLAIASCVCLLAMGTEFVWGEEEHSGLFSTRHSRSALPPSRTRHSRSHPPSRVPSPHLCPPSLPLSFQATPGSGPSGKSRPSWSGACPSITIHPSIQAIGFDMDYTLAQYKPETFEGLAHQQTVRCVEWTISIVFETGQQNLLLYMYSHKYRQGSPPLSLLALNDAETSA
jgi:hypothetical protein